MNGRIWVLSWVFDSLDYGTRQRRGTWVDLSVAANPVRIHNVLKAGGKLIGLVVSRWRLVGLHGVQDGGNRGATFLLEDKSQKEFWLMGLLYGKRPTYCPEFPVYATSLRPW